MRTVIMTALIGMSLVGCSDNQDSKTSAQGDLMKGQVYQVERIGERPLVDNSHVTITFGENGQASGSSGCNQWTAKYTLDGEKLHFSPGASSRRMCLPALMEQENRFLKALNQVTRWDFSEKKMLQLWSTTGQPIQLLPAK